MNKWFPNIQFHLLDVGFPTFNVTYCTSGSQRVDTALIDILYNRIWLFVHFVGSLRADLVA